MNTNKSDFSCEKNTASLSFDTQNDALNFADQLFKDSNRWLSSKDWCITDDYLNGHNNIHLHMSSLTDSCKFQLVFSVIPFIDANRGRALDKHATSSLSPAQNETIVFAKKRQDFLVFVGPRHSTQFIKDVVPSIMRIQCLNEFDDCLIDITAAVSECASKIVNTLSEREIHSLTIRSSECYSAIANCLIEGISKVVDDVVRENPNLGWNPVFETETNDLLSGLKIGVVKDIIVTQLDESIVSRFKIDKAFFSAVDE